MTADERRREQYRRLSAYGVIKRSSVLAALPPDEQEEVERLEARAHRSAPAEARLASLWDKAHDRHVPPHEDPLFAYAREIGSRMRARQNGDDT
jgi:hypothetical protein